MSFASVFLICKTQEIFIPTSQDYFEDQMIKKKSLKYFINCNGVDIAYKHKLLSLNPKVAPAAIAIQP